MQTLRLPIIGSIPYPSIRQPRPLQLAFNPHNVCRASIFVDINGRRSDWRLLASRERIQIVANENIKYVDLYSTVRVLDGEKEMLGVFSLQEALNMARQRDVDLVLQSGKTDPPLCRLVEIGKYKYELEKKSQISRQKQRASRVLQKELKMRPATDTHDYQVRLRKAIEELGRGNQVKVIVQHRGREIENIAQGENIVKRFIADLGERATIEKPQTMEGRNLTVILGPNRK